MNDLNGKLKLHSSFNYAVTHHGSENTPVLVVDNFLSDPQVLIDFAAAHGSFGSVADTFYPGVRTLIPQIYTFALRAFLGPIIAQAFELRSNEVVKELAHFSLITTRPDKLQILQRLPHFDSTDDKQFALLHYLSPKPQGGTSFYRHRESGFESIRPDRLASYSAAVAAELRSLGEPARQYIDGDTPQFQRVASYDGLFNRLLVYRSISLHSANVPDDFDFSHDPRTGRLTANSFFFFR